MTTPEPRFLLKEAKSETPTLISVVMRFNNQRFVYSTGEKVNPENWDFKAQRVRNSKKIIDRGEINQYLDKLAYKSKEIFRTFKAEGKFISPVILKKELEEVFGNVVRKEETTFLGFIECFIEENKVIKKECTIKSYRTTLKHLQNFKKKKVVDVEFETIDILFYNKFRDYLTTELNLSLNTVGKQIQIVKTFLSDATQRGLNKNLSFRERNFKCVSEDVKHIYLSKEDIDKLYNTNLSMIPSWEAVRDLFVIGCYTGLRFRDLAGLSESNIKTDGTKEHIEVITNKTGERVIIPMAKTVKEIFRKYNYVLPNVSPPEIKIG